MMSWSRSVDRRYNHNMEAGMLAMKTPLKVEDIDHSEEQATGDDGVVQYVRSYHGNNTAVRGHHSTEQVATTQQVYAVDSSKRRLSEEAEERNSDYTPCSVIYCPWISKEKDVKHGHQQVNEDYYYGIDYTNNNDKNHSTNVSSNHANTHDTLNNNNNTLSSKDRTTKYVKNSAITQPNAGLYKSGIRASGSKKLIQNKLCSDQKLDKFKKSNGIHANRVALGKYDYERFNQQSVQPNHVTLDRARHIYSKTIEVKLLTPANMAISNFHIKFDHNGSFKPGQEVTGKVIMDVWARTEVCYVEFLLHGKGTVRIFKNSSTFIERPRHEVYLKKQIMLISPPHEASSMILNPGRYVSDFRYCLSEKLPPSVHQFDMGNGYVFDISYSAHANVCDSVGNRYIQPLEENYAKVIKSVRCSFYVLPLIDWGSLPGASESVNHKEQLLLFCSCTSKPTKVSISLDRSVYQIGDTIKVRLHITNPVYRQSVKVIRANLEQRMLYKGDLIQKFRKILISVQDDVEYNPHNEIHTGFNIPIPTTIVPSYLPHCDILDITYNMKVTVQFKGIKGKLTVRVPLIIAPPSRKINQPRNVFGTTTRTFPTITGKSSSDEGIGTLYTSTKSSDDSGSRAHTPAKRHGSNTMDTKYSKNIQDQITTKYKTGLKCSSCCLVFCRFGIYEEEEE